MSPASAAFACARGRTGLLLLLLLTLALPAAACERHLSGHQNGTDSAQEASRR
jgi:hypothetical protein